MLLNALLETDVEYWLTGNADSNDHMLHINELLNHEHWLVGNEYEITKDKWKLNR